MQLSKTAGYTVRSIIHLARENNGKRIMAKEIAKDENIPKHYAAKILQKLAKSGYAESYKGRGGGFTLAPKMNNLSIYDVIGIVQNDIKVNACLFNLVGCTSDTPCSFCIKWKEISKQINDLLLNQKVSDLAHELDMQIRN